MGEQLGEREIIEIIQNRLDKMAKLPVPFGDDVSGYDIGEGNLAILKTDMLVDKTDVPPSMSLWQAARKAVVMNVSDFAAKGVRPLAMLVSLGLPKRLTEEDIKKIGEGLNSGAREYNSYVIGGDTNEASDLIISLSVFGLEKRDLLMLRDGAKPEDIVAVTNNFGKTYAGLKVLLDDLVVPDEIRETLVDSVLMPHARLQEGLALAQTGAVTASVDSSDGLAWSLHEIAKASSVGFRIDSLPIAREAEIFAVANDLDSAELTLYGGEEYELVLTVKPKLWDEAEEAVSNVGGILQPIGKVTDEEQVQLDIQGETSIIEGKGWEHFKGGKV